MLTCMNTYVMHVHTCINRNYFIKKKVPHAKTIKIVINIKLNIFKFYYIDDDFYESLVTSKAIKLLILCLKCEAAAYLP